MLKQTMLYHRIVPTPSNSLYTGGANDGNKIIFDQRPNDGQSQGLWDTTRHFTTAALITIKFECFTSKKIAECSTSNKHRL